jgi:hypothetical protein
MQALLNLGSSWIELAMGNYKLGSATNGVFVVPVNGGMDHLL